MSFVVSLPLLLGILAADVLIGYEAVTGYTRILRSLVDSLQPPWFDALLLYALFGPVLACLLCLIPTAPSGPEATAARGLRGSAHRVRLVGVLVAVTALGLVLLTGLVLAAARGGT
ncbi:MAG TPA: hypothetical protein VKR83_15130 [Ktedonobacteraceae bacterium]|nr:hypothetical protein [Ktedonobacteraceae bacterium]